MDLDLDLLRLATESADEDAVSSSTSFVICLPRNKALSSKYLDLADYISVEGTRGS